MPCQRLPAANRNTVGRGRNTSLRRDLTGRTSVCREESGQNEEQRSEAATEKGAKRLRDRDWAGTEARFERREARERGQRPGAGMRKRPVAGDIRRRCSDTSIDKVKTLPNRRPQSRGTRGEALSRVSAAKGFTDETSGSTEKKAKNREARRNGGERPRPNTQSKAGWEPKPESGSQLACFILMRFKIERAYYFNTNRSSGNLRRSRFHFEFFREILEKLGIVFPVSALLSTPAAWVRLEKCAV